MVCGKILDNAGSPLVFITGHTFSERLVFQQDNDHPHTATVTKACCEQTDTTQWSVTSPGLFLTENVRDAI